MLIALSRIKDGGIVWLIEYKYLRLSMHMCYSQVTAAWSAQMDGSNVKSPKGWCVRFRAHIREIGPINQIKLFVHLDVAQNLVRDLIDAEPWAVRATTWIGGQGEILDRWQSFDLFQMRSCHWLGKITP